MDSDFEVRDRVTYKQPTAYNDDDEASLNSQFIDFIHSFIEKYVGNLKIVSKIEKCVLFV